MRMFGMLMVMLMLLLRLLLLPDVVVSDEMIGVALAN